MIAHFINGDDCSSFLIVEVRSYQTAFIFKYLRILLQFQRAYLFGTVKDCLLVNMLLVYILSRWLEALTCNTRFFSIYYNLAMVVVVLGIIVHLIVEVIKL